LAAGEHVNKPGNPRGRLDDAIAKIQAARGEDINVSTSVKERSHMEKFQRLIRIFGSFS
jgi:hypothetical protein